MNDLLTIQGTEVHLVTPEGMNLVMPLDKFLDKLAPPKIDTGGIILPDGTKAAFSQGSTTVWVYEAPPRVYCLRWLANDSPVRFGPAARYRTVRLALPYLVLLGVFATAPNGQLLLSQRNECYFRTAPLKSLSDELFYPALLNCSKIISSDGRAMSWVCTQHLNFAALAREQDLNRRLCLSFRALHQCLLETGFNYSSEHHEGSSWFSESSQVDRRISTVEKWEEASQVDPLFVLEVPWIKTGLTLGQTVEALFKLLGCGRRTYENTAALARILLNQQAKPKRQALTMQSLLEQLST
jgi:hypothetical protein